MSRKIINNTKKQSNALFNELSLLIESSQRHLVSEVNSTLTMLFWRIGERINKDILQNKRADYGKEIVVTLSRQLQAKYGSNFEEKNLRRMLQFNTVFPEWENVVTLSRQLSWSHFLALIPIKSRERRLFYAEKAGAEIWGIRELRKNISDKVFERTAIAKMQLHEEVNKLDVFKDPYFLNFPQYWRRSPDLCFYITYFKKLFLTTNSTKTNLAHKIMQHLFSDQVIIRHRSGDLRQL
jgi:hypothetical protein